MDPIGDIEKKLDGLEDRVRTAVEAALLREGIRFAASRLLTLDPSRAPMYNEVLSSLSRAEN